MIEILAGVVLLWIAVWLGGWVILAIQGLWEGRR